MDIYLLIILVLLFLNVKFFKTDFNKNYINKENSSTIKGIFILIIFFSHSLQYTFYNEYSFFINKIAQFLGQLVVAMFLFYSGYGVFESIKKKKKSYIKSMPKKRLLKTLINFDFIILLYGILFFLLNHSLPKKQFLLSLIGWESIGNSNWYIFVIVGLYFLTFISFTFFDKDNKSAIHFMSFLSIVFILFLGKYKESYWYNTILCYPFGMYYSFYKEKIEKYLSNNKYVLILLCSICSFYVFKLYEMNSFIYQFLSIIFCFIIVLVTMKLQFNSKIIKWFGDNLFWVYILQRIPMIILSSKTSIKGIMFFIISFVITIILVFIIKNVVNKILNLKKIKKLLY